MGFATKAGPIVHVVQHLRPGGLEVMALELARIQARGHPTLVVSLDGDLETTLECWPRLQAQRDQLIFMGKEPGVDPWLALRLRSLFRRLGAVGVHTHHVGPLLYAGPAARLAGVTRRVHTEHDAWHLQNASRRRIMRCALIATNPVLIADAPYVADAVARALSRPPPRVILNGVDTDRFSPGDRIAARRALGLPDHGRIIGIAARLERVKGVDLAIDALASVPGALLAIAGGGSERESLQMQAASLGLAERVRFLGHLDDTLPLYRAIDLLCLPSRAEGLPLALLEAQSTGTPVVAMRVGGVSAGVDPATGVLVDPEQPGALARALQAQAPQEGAVRECTGARIAASPRTFVERTASLNAMASAYTSLMLEAAP
jgi:glycosyltransferase involved in cell wall biosynthesis